MPLICSEEEQTLNKAVRVLQGIGCKFGACSCKMLREAAMLLREKLRELQLNCLKIFDYFGNPNGAAGEI